MDKIQEELSKSGHYECLAERRQLETVLTVIDKATEAIKGFAKGGNVLDKVMMAQDELTDDFEECGEVSDEKVDKCKRELIRASRYAGYTTIQYVLAKEVKEILSNG